MSKSNENKSFRQTKATKCLLGGLLAGGAPTGEIHLKRQCASEALLIGVAPTGEIHLKQQCAPEGLLTGVGSKGEFHELLQ